MRALDGKTEDVAAGDIYVVGGGVRATHAEFGSRVLSGHSLDGSDSREDCSGGVSTGKLFLGDCSCWGGVGNHLNSVKEFSVPCKTS